MMENVEKEKKTFKILGFNLWEIFAYFIIYSVARICYRNFICIDYIWSIRK